MKRDLISALKPNFSVKGPAICEGFNSRASQMVAPSQEDAHLLRSIHVCLKVIAFVDI